MKDAVVLGISGSLRRGSINTSLLRAAGTLAPSGMLLELYEGLRQIPPFDPDVGLSSLPEVVHLSDLIHQSDALLIATPEYNYGVPGVLKNALDWMSVSDGSAAPPLEAKAVAIMGASPSPFGTVRAQLSLRQFFLGTNSRVVTRPEVHVFDAYRRLDKDGRLVDQTTAEFLRGLLESLLDTISLTEVSRERRFALR